MARILSFAVLFLGLCLSRLALSDEPASIPPATTQQVQQTVERAMGYLQTESATWLCTRKFAACHHAGMPFWALSEADRQGYSIDKKFLTETTKSFDELLALQRADGGWSQTVPELKSDAFASGQTLYGVWS